MLCLLRVNARIIGSICPSLSQGDSGGGVVFNGKLIGVHVMGGKIACTQAGVFMNICEKVYKDWIKHTMNAAGTKLG